MDNKKRKTIIAIIGIVAMVTVISIWACSNSLAQKRNMALAEYGQQQFETTGYDDLMNYLDEASGLSDLEASTSIYFNKYGYDRKTKTLKVGMDLDFTSKEIRQLLTEEDADRVEDMLYTILDAVLKKTYVYTMEGLGNVEIDFSPVLIDGFSINRDDEEYSCSLFILSGKDYIYIGHEMVKEGRYHITNSEQNNKNTKIEKEKCEICGRYYSDVENKDSIRFRNMCVQCYKNYETAKRLVENR